MRKFFVKIFFLIITVFILLSSSCKKEKIERIPNVPINISIWVNSVEFNALNTIGGWVYVTGGYRGLIIYRLNNDVFVSYDRACPYHPSEEGARIEVEESGLIAVDSLCGSRFFLSDGSVLKGPSTLPMKSYITSFDGTYVTIFN